MGYIPVKVAFNLELIATEEFMSLCILTGTGEITPTKAGNFCPLSFFWSIFSYSA